MAWRYNATAVDRRPEGTLEICRGPSGFSPEPSMVFVFGDCEIHCERRQLRRDRVDVHVEPQVFDVLVHLVRHRNRVVSKEELIGAVWDGRSVSDDTLTSRVSAARRAIGDSGAEQRLIRTVTRRGFRFVGDAREAPDGGPLPPSETSPGPERTALEQDVRFCRAADGVNLAVATAGAGSPLVKAANWLNHLEFDWQSPVWSPLFRCLAARCTLVRYDERGTGLSDRDVRDFSFDAFVRDLETVVDACGLERFALMGISQGAPVSIAYAVLHPERVSRLVLCGGFARGWRKRGNAAEVARAEASVTLIREGWGQDNPAARQMFTSLIVPDATLEEMQWFNELEQISASADTAVRLLYVLGGIDVTALLRRVAVPTLVLHSRGDARVPFEHGLALARAIPGARFVALESRNHIILSHEAAWPRFIDEICGFLTVTRGRARSLSPDSPGFSS
jgi:DNA-binding winged helix-turn-helix (wHTH) protein/pimeloyl-ACP methyl ester carboxylesterase